jgi:D-sedoheptulose 7-phosphate isomerase
MQTRVRAILSESEAVHSRMATSDDFVKSISEMAVRCCTAIRSGKKILFAGNGGSAADAQHLAAELVNRFNYERHSIAAIALSTDTSVITSIGNDSGFESIFSRQIEAIGGSGDILILLSTSGDSPNIVKAAKAGKERGVIVAGFTGESENRLTGLSDIVVRIPSGCTPRIQEGHILAGHILCDLIEAEIYPKNT